MAFGHQHLPGACAYLVHGFLAQDSPVYLSWTTMCRMACHAHVSLPCVSYKPPSLSPPRPVQKATVA